MANNELSGPVLATYLAMYILSKPKRRYSYRFLFTSETIGTIYYISRNLEQLKKHVKCGFVLTCVGDEGDFSYLPSRYGNTLADKLVLNLLNTEVKNFKTYSYLERGSDEREYCFPGVDLPLCLLMKSKFGKYKEYHTSLDNLDFVTPKGLQESYDMYVKIIETLENNYTYKVATICEPFMSKYGLYETISFRGSSYTRTLMNFLVYSDGNNDLIDIANLIKESAYNIIDIAHLLEEKKLINKVT
jgi:aminopeptidase-like protein